MQMDPFERYPINYIRRLVEIERPSPWSVGPDGPALAWTYFATPAASVPVAENLLPEPEYLEHLLAGAAFLSADYLACLQQQPVFRS